MALASVCGLSDHSQRATHYKIHCDDENDAHFQNALNTEGSFALPRGQHVRSYIIASNFIRVFSIRSKYSPLCIYLASGSVDPSKLI